jgi:two-component system, response regulator PdtaR
MRSALVVDDHEPSRKDLVRALTANGFEIVGEVTTGAAGLHSLSDRTPDVILMAVGLPDVDGIRAARRIMEANPRPIVLITSHYDGATIDRAKQSGIMGYLIKPLRESELLPTIELAITHFHEFILLQKENESLKKTLEARKLIEQAKGILMKQQGLSEAEAFSMIQRKSMDTRKPMSEIARAIILTQGITKEGSL